MVKQIKKKEVCCENCQNFAVVKSLLEKGYSDSILSYTKNALEELKATDESNQFVFYQRSLYLTINFLLKELAVRPSNSLAIEALKKYMEEETELNLCANDPVKKLAKDLLENNYTRFPKDYLKYNKPGYTVNKNENFYQMVLTLFSQCLPKETEESKPFVTRGGPDYRTINSGE